MFFTIKLKKPFMGKCKIYLFIFDALEFCFFFH